MQNLNRNPKAAQVFLSYSTRDKVIARRISDELARNGFVVWHGGKGPRSQNQITEVVDNELASSHFIIFLISAHSIESKLMSRELSLVNSDEFYQRDIRILPVLISDVEIPAPLRTRKYFDLRNHTDDRIRELVEQLLRIDQIGFNLKNIDAQHFEHLVGDVMRNLGFKNIRYNVRLQESDVDIVAEYRERDPFGRESLETWLVECKFYSHDRPTLQSLRDFAARFSIQGREYRALFVTNSQLTSVAKEWITEFERRVSTSIRIIEGPELRDLLSKTPELVRTYFGETNELTRDP